MRNILKMFSLCVLVSSCNISCLKNVIYPKHVRDESYEAIANGIEAKLSKRLWKEKRLSCIGTGGRMMNDIQMMSMSFLFYHEMDLIEARKLLVYAMTQYLNAINESKKIRPYLHNYPFTVQDVEILIWIKNPDGSDLATDKIGFVSAYKSKCTYQLANEPDKYLNVDLHEETYEEALKIVKEQEDVSQPQAS